MVYGRDCPSIINNRLLRIASIKVAVSEILVVLSLCLPNGILYLSKYCADG